MTRAEFATVMAYLATAINKPLSEAGTIVYFDLLGDVPLKVLEGAVRRVALEHKWASFPSVAEIREAVVEAQRGSKITPADAWDMVWRAAARIDPEVEGSLERATKGMPPLVFKAMKAFGISALCCGKEPVGVIRGQFMKMFENFAVKEDRKALLPPRLREQIAAMGQMPQDVKRIGSDSAS